MELEVDLPNYLYDKPDDYVVSTGETHSVKEFVERAFNHVGLNWEDYVIVDERFFRPF